MRIQEKQKRLVTAIRGDKPCIIKWHPDSIIPIEMDSDHITIEWAKNRKQHGQVIYKEV